MQPRVNKEREKNSCQLCKNEDLMRIYIYGSVAYGLFVLLACCQGLTRLYLQLTSSSTSYLSGVDLVFSPFTSDCRRHARVGRITTRRRKIAGSLSIVLLRLSTLTTDARSCVPRKKGGEHGYKLM